MKILKKREPQQIASNHFSDIYFKYFMKPYKDYTEEPYSLLVNDITLLYNSLQFRKKLFENEF